MSEVEIPYISRKQSDSEPDIFEASDAWGVIRKQISIKLELATNPSTENQHIENLQKAVSVLDNFMSSQKDHIYHANTQERKKSK